jgi:uncharacterized phage protein (TIGR01671 family)
MLVSILTGLISVEGCGMRDIKFRGWVGEKKIDNFCVGTNLFGVSATICDVYDKWSHIELDCIEQFTGLLDSNGVEIYEGDIILSEHDGSVVVEWSVRAAKFGVHVLRHHTYSIEKKTKLRAIPRDGIVIGNIHQNPELLK